jgi:hypothetical protein
MIDVVYGEVPFPRVLSEFDRNLFEHTWATMSPDTSEWFGDDGHIQPSDLAKLALLTSVLTNMGSKHETFRLGGLGVHDVRFTKVFTMHGLLAQELIDADPENASRFMWFNKLVPIDDASSRSDSEESDARVTKYHEEQERLRVLTLSMAMVSIARTADLPVVQVDFEQVIEHFNRNVSRFNHHRPLNKGESVSICGHGALRRVISVMDTVNKIIQIGKITFVSLEANHPISLKSRAIHLPRGNEGIGSEFGKLIKVLGITDLAQLR